MSMIKRILLICFFNATVLLLSFYAFAAASNGTVEVSRLEMVIKSVTLKTGQSRTVNVTISPGKADDKSITWSSSDNSVATVKAAGKDKASITGVSEGTVKITATSTNGKTAECTVTVSDDEIEARSIKITSQTATIKINQRKLLSVVFSPSGADDKSVDWSSANPDIVSVSDKGVITGKSPGTAEITAMSANGKTDVCTVTVLPETITEVERQQQNEILTIEDNETSLSSSVSMTVGKERNLSGFIRYVEQYRDDDGDWYTQWRLVGAVTWASSFPDVVSVNDKGVAVAKRAGTSRITATGLDNNGRKRVQTIVVGVTRGTGGSTADSFEMYEGACMDFSQIGKLHSGAKNIKWSSSIPEIASVDSSGLALARSIGRCTVTASYTDENNTKQSIKYKLRITSGMLRDKTQNSTVILKPGDKIDLGGMYYPNYQDSPYALNQYSCTTGTQNILAVNGLTVSAKAAGTGSVLIRHTDGSGETICHKLTAVVKK